MMTYRMNTYVTVLLTLANCAQWPQIHDHWQLTGSHPSSTMAGWDDSVIPLLEGKSNIMLIQITTELAQYKVSSQILETHFL